MKNRLIVNARFMTQPLTGVQRYALEVLRRFPSSVLVTPGLPLDSYQALLNQHDLRVRGVFSSVKPFTGHLWEQLFLPIYTNFFKGHLWSPGGSGPLAVRQQTLTIHDVAHIEHPEWYDPKFARLYKTLLPKLTRRVTSIITVSNFVKVRLIEIYDLPPEKVYVTHLGVDHTLFVPASQEKIDFFKKKHQISRPYLVTVSGLSKRKNLRRLVQAWSAGPLSKELELVIIGVARLPFASKSDLPKSRGVRFIGYIPDKDLPVAYSGAIAALYVSLYEGFGLPVLEAMACGTPVVTSNVTALPEVVGDAAVLVDPYDVDSIAEGIRRVVEDSALRETLRRKGIERARQFSWDRTAELTWKVLQEAAENE